jgi:hypothetical protein
MTLGAEREAGSSKSIPRVQSDRGSRVRLTEIVSPFTGFWLMGLPRKDMDVSYFAETKGLVGCHYSL